MEQSLDRKIAIAELSRSGHGDLGAYAPTAVGFAVRDPEFYAHLIAWNQTNGEVRDSKIALPLWGLVAPPTFTENAQAHLALQPPRDFLRGLKFVESQRPLGISRSALRKLAQQYVDFRERDSHRFFRTVLQHRKSMHELYARFHLKPGEHAASILFKGESVGPNRLLRSLAGMSDAEAAATIIKERIPFQAIGGALGNRLKSQPLVLALIEAMSPSELATNAKRLGRLGTDTDPVLRAAFREAMGHAAASSTPSLKLAKAAAAVESSETKAHIERAQEAQLDSRRLEGNWLIIADVSGSMELAIGVAAEVAAILARLAKGEVRIAFTNTGVRAYNATGKTLEQIRAETSQVRASGGTQLGTALQWAISTSFTPDGIAVISDGADNYGVQRLDLLYPKATAHWEKEVPVYHYDVDGQQNNFRAEGFAGNLHTFPLRGKPVDSYSLLTLAQTMRTNTFSLTDAIFESRLLSLADVFA